MTNAYPSMLSVLIKDLQVILDEQGDMPVFTKGFNHLAAKVDVNTIPPYYDGGCLLPAVDTEYHVQHWLRSKTHRDLYPLLCEISTDEPESYFRGDSEEQRDTVDGVPVEGKEDAAVFALPTIAAKGDTVDCPTCGAQWQNYGHPEAYWMADGHEG